MKPSNSKSQPIDLTTAKVQTSKLGSFLGVFNDLFRYKDWLIQRECFQKIFPFFALKYFKENDWLTAEIKSLDKVNITNILMMLQFFEACIF